MAEKPRDARSGPNEGEGSQTGARDVSGPNADALKRAEAEGKRHSHGEYPQVKR